MTATLSLFVSRGLPLDLEAELDAARPLMAPADTAALESLISAGDAEGVKSLVARVRQARLRELTVHTEVSTLRLRGGEITEDVSSVFRSLMSPSPEPDALEFITDLGFEERGGASGTVQGAVFAFTFAEPHIYACAAPADTVLLPEGFEIRLRRGEQVILRNAGHHADEAALGLDAFRPGASSVAVVAEEDGVVITGPATLAPFSEIDLAVLAVAASKADKRARFLSVLALSLRRHSKDPAIVRPADLGMTSPEHAALLGALRLSNWTPRTKIGVEARQSYLRHVPEHVFRTHILRLFPARKVVTRGTAGVRTIRPQSRLTRG